MPSFDEQVMELDAHLDAVEIDVIADQGQEMWDCGAWYDVTRDQIVMSDYPDEVKREVARTHGIWGLYEQLGGDLP